MRTLNPSKRDTTSGLLPAGLAGFDAVTPSQAHPDTGHRLAHAAPGAATGCRSQLVDEVDAEYAAECGQRDGVHGRQNHTEQ